MNIEDIIIYEDRSVIVVRKPAGIAVQSASFGQKDLESMLKTRLFEKEGKAAPYLGIVHRLDQPVQGLVVFAKDPKSCASLSTQIQSGKMCKEYLAVVCGQAKEQDELVHFLKKDPRTNLSQTAEKGDKNAKKALLSYRLLEQREDLALIRISLKTGRHHQIRVQMKAAGLPLYGDQKYNPMAQKGEMIALCAAHLEFDHPGTGKRMRFDCEGTGGAFDRMAQPG